MSDVKRYTMDENSLMGGMDMFEYDDGDYALHSDYSTILARHNALVEAVAWERECGDAFDVDGWSFWMDDAPTDELCLTYNAARADVDRLIAAESEK